MVGGDHIPFWFVGKKMLNKDPLPDNQFSKFYQSFNSGRSNLTPTSEKGEGVRISAKGRKGHFLFFKKGKVFFQLGLERPIP